MAGAKREEGRPRVDRNDQAVDHPDRAYFGFPVYARTLARLLRESDPPFTLGIFGNWGAGKTGLMRLVRRELTDPSEPGVPAGPPWHVPVWFDVWKYDREEVVWRALLVHTLDSVRDWVDARRPPGKGEKRPEDALPILASDHLERLDDWLHGEAEDLRARLYRPLQRTEPGELQLDWAKLGKGAARLAVPLVAGGSIPAVQTLLEGLGVLTRRKGKLVTDDGEVQASGIATILDAFHRGRREAYFAELRDLHQFQETFRDAVRALRATGAVDRLVFFIDDLDRCVPGKAIEVLEAVKLFLETEHCLFVLGVDQRVIHAGIDARYREFFGAAAGGDHGRGLDFKREYLEKIVQLAFPLPPVEDREMRRFLADQLRLGEDGNEPVVAEVLAVAVEPNPRKIKRLCWAVEQVWRLASALRAVAEARLREGERVVDLHPEALAKLVTIHQRAPEVYARFTQDYWLLIQLEQHWRQEERGAQTTADTDAEAADPTAGPSRRAAKGPDDAPEATADAHAPAGPDVAAAEPASAPRRASALERLLEVLEPPGDLERYRWLREMLLWQPSAEGEVCETFETLGERTRHHVQLAAATVGRAGEEEAGDTTLVRDLARVDEQTLAGLLGEDPELVESLVESLAEEQRPAYRSALAREWASPRTEPRRRAAARLALDGLGDERPGVSLRGDGLPDIAWVYVPATPETHVRLGTGFGIPDDQALAHERWPDDKPPIALRAFYLAAYPLTVAQFRPFVEALAYERKDFWTDAGWSWVKSQARVRNRSDFWNHQVRSERTRPAVSLTWFEAVAYCRWMNDCLREAGESGSVRLPSEAEWEWAARGPEGRRYPWEALPSGESAVWEPGRCNAGHVLSTTSAVGAFPRGRMDGWAASQVEGVPVKALHDLAGNVWEWCASTAVGDYADMELPPRVLGSDGQWSAAYVEYLAGQTPRVVRGGSFFDHPRAVRCGFRQGFSPDLPNFTVGLRLARDE